MTATAQYFVPVTAAVQWDGNNDDDIVALFAGSTAPTVSIGNMGEEKALVVSYFGSNMYYPLGSWLTVSVDHDGRILSASPQPIDDETFRSKYVPSQS